MSYAILFFLFFVGNISFGTLLLCNSQNKSFVWWIGFVNVLVAGWSLAFAFSWLTLGR